MRDRQGIYLVGAVVSTWGAWIGQQARIYSPTESYIAEVTFSLSFGPRAFSRALVLL